MKLEDLCSDLGELPPEHRANGLMLLEALNPIEEIFFRKFGRLWTATSGYRFLSEHLRIYAAINTERRAQGKPPLPIPMGSQHLIFNAVDIEDRKQDVKLFVADQLHLFEEADIYFEGFEYTKDWVHMQRISPASGRRFFIPF